MSGAAGPAVAAATGSGVWTPAEPRRLEGRNIVDLDGEWALTADGLWSWTAGEQRARFAGTEATSMAAADGVVFVGTRGAHLLRVGAGAREGEAVAGFDEAEGRDGWYTPWGGPPDTRSISTAPDGTLYANVHVGGILRSDDGGVSWVPTIDVDADVHEVVGLDGGRVLAATAQGLATSSDRGRTWSFSTAGLHAGYCRALAVAGDWLLVSASTGPRTDRGAVYRRPLGAGEGEPFERCARGLPAWFSGNVDTGGLAGSGSHAALASPEGDLYVSGDAGESWSRLARDLGRVSRVRISGD